eukprot:TRINITY_DN39703_c0_g1_i1.p1 TRINITY_DN39703_c0_g1~~TRINITY_DN39703_c0_g1_i1.p1  ORF type:complete len:148 (-),score=40.41 TRINITY_DN39703_c0_g1_i1:299-703(-)
MLRSLVGSEMCIRDSPAVEPVHTAPAARAAAHPHPHPHPRPALATALCSVCGIWRELSTLEAHQRHCLAARDRVQARLPPSQRTGLMEAPPLAIPRVDATSEEIELYNLEVQARYNSAIEEYNTVVDAHNSKLG